MIVQIVSFTNEEIVDGDVAKLTKYLELAKQKGLINEWKSHGRLDKDGIDLILIKYEPVTGI